MSKYTTELRFICETYAGLNHSDGYDSIDSVIHDSLSKLFDFDFPIFDENYRSVLETKIVKHYYTREICCETVGRWKLFLNSKINEIMPYYNQLYESANLEYNPLYDADYTKEGNREGEENGENTSTNLRTDNLSENVTGTRTDNLTETRANTRTDNLTETSTNTRTDNLTETSSNTRTDNLTETNSRTVRNKNDHWDYYSDTPQGGLSGIQNNTYLTNVRHVTDDSDGSTESNTKKDTGTVQNSGTVNNTGTQQNSGTINNTGTQQNVESKTNSGTQTNALSGTNTLNTTDSYLEHVYGKMPGTTYSKLIDEYRKTLLNIDLLIIDELSDLFFNLW